MVPNPFNPIARFSQRLQVGRLHQKIGLGYFTAIGIGLIGSVVGIVVADYYQGRILEKFGQAQAQTQLLQDFELTTDDFRLDLTRIVVQRQSGMSTQPTLSDLTRDRDRFQSQRQDIAAFFAGEPSWRVAEAEEIETLTQTYTDALSDALATVAAQSDRDVASDRALEQLQEIAAGLTAQRLDQLHQELQRLVETARAQERLAGDAMEAAQGWEKLIIFVSLLISAAIAGLLAWRTSRSIAGPLESLTQVAQRFTETSDFNLRAEIVADDEVGALAQSLNRLIQRMQVRTTALQQTAQRAKTQTHQLQQTLNTLQKTQAQLIQTEKMSSLGQMVAGIAHEINNPVSFIYGNLNYAKGYIKDLLALIKVYKQALPEPPPAVTQCQDAIEYEFLQEDLPKLLTSLEAGAERIRSIVLSLRIFSRLNEADIKPVDIEESIESTLVILNTRIRAQPNRPAIVLTKRYGQLPLIECYAGQLNQVFMNILANAIDALDEKWIQMQSEDLGPEDLDPEELGLADLGLNHPSASADAVTGNGYNQPEWQPKIEITTATTTGANGESQVYITISDNANGIPEASQAKIFDPFFTTKAVGKGTGLGLSISYEIVVDKHGGELMFKAVPGEGTTFKIKLPQKIQPQLEGSRSPEPASSAATVN
ncbi:MAG: ATP-binding protein [Cyanobacteria bacterium P01_C01_bin.73]